MGTSYEGAKSQVHEEHYAEFEKDYESEMQAAEKRAMKEVKDREQMRVEKARQPDTSGPYNAQGQKKSSNAIQAGGGWTPPGSKE